MSANLGTATPGMSTLRQQARRWWLARTPRERQMVAGVVGVIVLFLVWTVLVAPALATVREAPGQLDRLDAQLQQMQRTATESGTLRSVPRVGAIAAAQALKSATDRLGTTARLQQQGDRATLTVTGIGAEALRTWLADVRGSARARPVEVNLQRASTGFNGTVIVAIGGNG